MATLTGTLFDRDDYARWYARRHLDIDDGIERVFYLPTDAPEREIRLLEVNRLIAETTPEPIDFGVNASGDDAHTLYVLDVTPSQWRGIEAGELALPAGWSLNDKVDLSH